MNSRRVLIILVIAVICAVATPTSESEVKACHQYPSVLIKQHWWPNSCGPAGGTICNDVVTLVGEEGDDCDGNSVSWGYVTNYGVTYRKIWCDDPC